MLINTAEIKNLEIIQDAFVAAHSGKVTFSVVGDYPEGVSEFPYIRVLKDLSSIPFFDFIEMADLAEEQATDHDFGPVDVVSFAILCCIARLGEDWECVTPEGVEITNR